MVPIDPCRTPLSLAHQRSADPEVAKWVNMVKSGVPVKVVQDKMEGDVYVYYQLKNFYQNHRTYVKSRSDKQLLGTELEKDEMDDCLPRKYAKVRARAAAPPSDARAARNL